MKKMKNLSNDVLSNFICKMPAPDVETSVKWARSFLVIGTTLLAGLLPFPANAQLSQETLNLSSEQNGIDQLQLFSVDEEIIPLSQERLNLLSEQDGIAQQQLSGQNEETDRLTLTSEFIKPVDNGDLKILEIQAFTTYSANPQVSPNRCTSSVFDNYGCYALQLQGGGLQFSSSVSPFSPPSAAALNAQEADRTRFPNGNPPGTWLEAQYPIFLNPSQPKSNFNQFAIGAAKAMYDWNTPVFFEINLGPGIFENAVLESITFNSPFSNALSTLCAISGFNIRGANVSTVASSCASISGINNANPLTTVSSIDIAYWPQTGSVPFNRIDRIYTGSSLDSFILNNFNKASSKTYVWDPPEIVETAEPVPEPSSALGLLAFGLFSVGLFFRSKRK